MKNISKNISYSEATHSNTAINREIKNEPDSKQLASMVLLAEKVFQPLREHFGKPIQVTSFFRSIALNRAIGGASNSQHLALNGAAIDIKIDKEMFLWIKDNLDFDQLIYEFGTDEHPQWVHVSYKAENNRKQVLKAIKEKGRTKYVDYQ